MHSMWDSVLAGIPYEVPLHDPYQPYPVGEGWYAPKTRAQWIHNDTIVNEAHVHEIKFSQYTSYLGGLHPNILPKKQQHRDNRCSNLFTHQRSRTSGTRPGSELKVTRERSQNLIRSLGRLSVGAQVDWVKRYPPDREQAFHRWKSPEKRHMRSDRHIQKDRGKGDCHQPSSSCLTRHTSETQNTCVCWETELCVIDELKLQVSKWTNDFPWNKAIA